MALDQGGVRIGRRVENRHPIEVHAALDDRHDAPDHGADLFVGVGDRDDGIGGDRLETTVVLDRDASPAAHLHDSRVGGGDAGEADEHGGRSGTQHGTDQPGERRSQWRAGEEPYEVPQLSRRLAEIGSIGRRIRDVRFLVERAEAIRDRFDQRDGAAGHAAAGTELRPDRSGELGHLAEQRRDAGFGGAMAGRGRKRPGVLRQGGADGGAQHGVGERAGIEQKVGAEQLGQAERGDETDVGDAVSAQRVASGEAGEVRRDHHGDRGQRRLGLRRRDDGAQRRHRLGPMAHDLHPFDHQHAG